MKEDKRFKNAVGGEKIGTQNIRTWLEIGRAGSGREKARRVRINRKKQPKVRGGLGSIGTV